MRLRKKKTKVEDLGELDETPEDEIVVQHVIRRNRVQLSHQLISRTREENELIRRHLGVDDRGRCLRHPNQHITGKVDRHRFESIHVCLICDSEIQAGGARQRKSMKNVIDSINLMQDDKVEWRRKTNILYHGAAYDPAEDENAKNELEKRKDKDDGLSIDSDNSENSLTHMLEFYDKAEEEERKAKKKKKRRKPKEEEEETDVAWKDEVALRVAHVRAWDDRMALSQNPTYAKYFRMKNVGIPVDAVRQSIELDGLDARIIDLDPNRPLQDQVDNIPGITDEEKEEMRKSDRLAFYTGDNGDDQPMNITQTVDVIHEAYVRRKQALQQLEDELDPKKQTLKYKVKSLFQKPLQPMSGPRRAKDRDGKPESSKPNGEDSQARSQTASERDSSRVQFMQYPMETVEEDKEDVASVPSIQEEGMPGVSVPEEGTASLTVPDSPPESTPQETKPTSAPARYYSAIPATPLPIFEEKETRKPKKQFKSITKIGTVKYSIARTNEQLAVSKEELAQRQVITGSLTTQLQSLEAQLKEKDEIIANLQHELYDLDPYDPLVPRVTPEEDEESSGPLKSVDRSDVIKNRLSKLSYTPASFRLR
eukprot:scaffold3015_cov122-Cylindrotheca_fusiformis.AAC.4